MKKNRNIVQHGAAIMLSSFCLLMAATILISAASPASASEITTLTIKQADNEVFINTAVKLDPKITEDLNNGLSKELVYSMELYRYSKIWANELITGRTISFSLQSNPIKREYVGTSTDNGNKTVKRFKDITSMIAWATELPEFRLTPKKTEPDANYLVRFTAESKIHTLPAVVGYILFFLPTREFSVNKESDLFHIPPPKAAK